MSLAVPVQILVALVAATFCFAIGGINPATIVGRRRGIEVSSVGSGNPGATNLGRVIGRKWGIAVGLLDVLKGFLPTFVVLRTLGTWVALLGGVACVLGHIYSPYLGGRGGKGVATSFGAILAVAPWVALVAVVVFAVALPFVKRLGDASVLATGFLLVAGVVLTVRATTDIDRGTGVWLVVMALLVLARHRRNIAIWAGRLTG
ncbi:glycerol-3-phosphate 1-O-acyltransferase PlsY [Knoellia locipacati]|uniref:Glycerol-3-phosphate acyltransferase n=1 Tax=Knoellia locipacati TaxID=882824 RepID=A0A512T591_9MICO|nr:glycerol-3-phosphate acyltransferase [Knoellia locipacati]GEQ15362.1 glycerol-3-phosphate acyltransferase [Knoellia locipacati]